MSVIGKESLARILTEPRNTVTRAKYEAEEKERGLKDAINRNPIDPTSLGYLEGYLLGVELRNMAQQEPIAIDDLQEAKLEEPF